MKTTAFILLAAVTLASTAHAGKFDRHTRACHDAAWAIDEFKSLPNAAISAYPGGFDDKTFYAYWIIDWDKLQVAGKCIMDLKSAKILKLQDFRKK